MVALTFQSSAAINTAQASYDFGALATGAANVNKRTFVAIGWRDTDNSPVNDLSSVSINGASVGGQLVKIHSNPESTDDSSCGVALAWANTPVGTTATVEAAFGGTIARCQVAVLSSADSIADSPFDIHTQVEENTDAPPFSFPNFVIDLPQGGVAIAICSIGFTSSSPNWTATGLDSEIYDDANGASRTIVALSNDVDAATGHAIAATFSGSGGAWFEPAGLAVSFASGAQIAALGIATGAPGVGAPEIGQEHVLTATGAVAGAPSLSSPALATTHAIDAASIAASEPSVGAPLFGQIYAFEALGVATAPPQVGAPAPPWSYDERAPPPDWFRKEEWRVLTGTQSYSGRRRARRPHRPPRPRRSWAAEHVATGLRMRLPRAWWS